MKKRILSAILTLCMLLSMIPMSVYSGSDPESILVLNRRYAIAPGVTEYERVTNNATLTRQEVGHVLEVDLTKGAGIVTGYNDYDIEKIKSGRGWGMKRTTDQAAAVESKRGVNVVGAVNGDFFNMSNGAPIAALVMNGTVINRTNGRPCFYIAADGTAHVGESWEQLPEGVLEAIGGSVVMVRDGKLSDEMTSGYDTTDNPRTAVGVKADGTVIIYMVDGRQAPYSLGMTTIELGKVMVELGCVSAINLDGGGSSTFATQREGEPNDAAPAGLTVRNSPSDGYERLVSSSLMVTALTGNGEFDHAVVSPYQEIYTPGSSVTLTADGVDNAGGPAELPGEGLSFEIVPGEKEIATLDAETGVLTGNSGVEGTVTVDLKYNGKTVGTTSIEFRYPDKLEFTNSSVSLDFGQSSNLSFNPTYQGRNVHFKDGDFTWELDEASPISYKYIAPVEIFYSPFWPAGNNQLGLSVSGKLGSEQTASFRADGGPRYSSVYEETSRSISYEKDGTVKITEVLTHRASTVYNSSFVPQFENIQAEAEATLSTEQIFRPDGAANNAKIIGLMPTRTVSFPVGSFSNNIFTADTDNSLVATVRVSVAGHEEVVPATVDLVIGMDPYVLMDFEAHGDQTAEEFWTTHVGVSSTGDNGQLTKAEIKANRLWVRSIGAENTIVWPTDAEGKHLNRIVSVDEDSNVRFGNYAFRLAWDFTRIDPTTVAPAELGFSAIVYVDEAQPTKIGMWINVPKELENDDSQLKGIFVGGGTPTANGTGLCYWQMNDDGTMTLIEDMNIAGTTSYSRYYSYDAEGNVNGEVLSDWAGKGWVWVETDISSYQMPFGVQRGYTVRVVSAQNGVKGKGSILLDNLQLIYGTNTNDTNNPVVDSVREATSGVTLGGGDVLTNGIVNFEVSLNDSERSDKYASGISATSIKLLLDGIDKTADAQINETGSSVLLTGLRLKNGSHTLTVSVKDKFGNKTEKDFAFTINDDAGENAILSVEAEEGAPMLGQDYVLTVKNKDLQPITYAEISVAVPAEYENNYRVEFGSGYTGSSVFRDGKILLTIDIDDMADSYADDVVSIILTVPGDTVKGDALKFAVPSGYYATAAETASFSQVQVSLEIQAAYRVAMSEALVGGDTVFTVTDAEGQPVKGVSLYSEGDYIGATDENGKLEHIFTSAGRVSIYAESNTGRSFNTDLVVSVVSKQNDGYPFGILNNANGNASTTRNITWFSSLKLGKDAALVRLSDDCEAVETMNSYLLGTSKSFTFNNGSTGVSLRLNSISLEGLKPNTTYYYQVGDGEKWSEVLTFRTSSDDAESATNFFVLGDIQTTTTERLVSALEHLANDDKTYAFGVQTGDAIDNVTEYGNWDPFLSILNASALEGADMIHTLGNHEYYGDIDGLISGEIYQLPASKQGSFYSVEYGNVYVAVINDGGDTLAALEAMVADAKETACTWKVLVMHAPIYGTNEEMNPAARRAYTDLIEEAGIDLVFGGDDHAYARTYPMIADEAQDEDSRDGVVYFVSGDLSGKDNTYNEHDYYVCSMPHADYLGMYMTVEADFESITVTAYDYDGNLLDSYTEKRTDCEVGRHTYDETSQFDPEDSTLTCCLCGEKGSAAETGISGMISVIGSDDKVMLVNGVAKTGWFAYGEDMLHAGENGVIHVTTSVDTRTCLTNGYIKTTCECGEIYRSAALWAEGHDWDEDHVCKKCYFVGIDLADAEIRMAGNYFLYTGNAVKGVGKLYYDGKELTTGSSRLGEDAYTSYSNNVNVGVATISFEGKGNYYGTISAQYTILPRPVASLSASDVTYHSVKVSWEAAPGATSYRLYEVVSGTKQLVTTVSSPEATIDGLNELSEHTYVVLASASVEGKNYNTSSWSSPLTVKLPENLDKYSATYLKSMSATVGGAICNEQLVDGDNYLFLPSSTDLANLTLTAEVDGLEAMPVISGDLGSAEMTALTDTIDLTAIASLTDGVYTVRVKIGDRQEVSYQIMVSSAIPSIHLISADADNAGRAYVDAAKGNSINGTMIMTNAAGDAVYNGGLKQIKSRGNSTFASYPKKSYQIKLTEATDLLGIDEPGKTFVLLAGYGDATQLHDKFFKDLAAEMGMEFVPSADWVDLYFDGQYRGTYLLTEKVSDTVEITDLEDAYEEKNETYGDDADIQSGTNAEGQTIVYTKGLVDPDDISGGYLIELNNKEIDELNGFMTRKGYAFNFKVPELLSKDAACTMSEYYQAFEDAVYATDNDGNYTGYNEKTGKYFYEYCDLDSLVRYFLIQQLSVNSDSFAKSTYFYKDANDIMYCGPVWDMEMVAGTDWGRYMPANGTINKRYLCEALIHIPAFMAAVDAYFNATFVDIVRPMIADSGVIDINAARLADSVAMNYRLWPLVKAGSPKSEDHLWAKGTTYDDVIAAMKTWLNDRLALLSNTFDGSRLETILPKTTSDIAVIDGVLHLDQKVTKAELLAMLANANDTIVVEAQDEGAEFIGTGTVLKLVQKSGADVLDTVVIIVEGDCSGDGISDEADLAAIADSFTGKEELTGVLAGVADMNNDGYIGANDYALLRLKQMDR